MWTKLKFLECADNTKVFLLSAHSKIILKNVKICCENCVRFAAIFNVEKVAVLTMFWLYNMYTTTMIVFAL